MEHAHSAHPEQGMEMCFQIPGEKRSSWLLAVGAWVQNGLQNAMHLKRFHFCIKDANAQNEEAPHVDINLHMRT